MNVLMKSLPPASAQTATTTVQLYRAIVKEVPRVLSIYDIDMSFGEARTKLAEQFRKNADVKDPRVIDMLVSKGYMELEETLMQYKQKTHLLRILEPDEAPVVRQVRPDFMAKFLAGKE